MKTSKFMLLLCAWSLVVMTSCAQHIQKGDDLPEFTLESNTYGNVSKADLQGKVVLINFFATWCGPCQKELAEVQETLWPKYKDRDDFRMLVVGREHTEEELTEYNTRKQFTFPLYPDPERKFYSHFAENTIPRAYLFNKEGKLVLSCVGSGKETFENLMKALEEELK